MTNKYYADILKEIRLNKGKHVELKPDDKILIIDGLNTFIRCFSVIPTLNDNGIHIGGLSGFLKSIGYAIRVLNPTRCIVVFDGKGGSQRRRKLYPNYKSNRKPNLRYNRVEDIASSKDEHQSMLMQLKRLVEYLEEMPITTIAMDRVEADDVIAYISQQIYDDSEIHIMSTDKDFLQLVNDRVKVWNPTKRMSFNPTRVMEEYNMPSHNFTIFRALDGDKSDNIKGIPGVGLKTLQKILPMLFEDKKVDLDELIKYAEEHQDASKVLKNIVFGKKTLYLNYILMQLHEVDISGNTKMNIMRSVREEIPTLVKYKIHKMCVEDKMWSAIPNIDTWLLNFVTLNKYADLKRKKSV